MHLHSVDKFYQGKEITIHEAAADMELTLQLLKNRLRKGELLGQPDMARMKLLIDQSLSVYESTKR